MVQTQLRRNVMVCACLAALPVCRLFVINARKPVCVNYEAEVQPTHQCPVYQLHTIRCGTVTTYAL